MSTKSKRPSRRGPQQSPVREWFQPARGAAIAVIALAAFAVYANSIPGHFVFDDTVIIQGNRSIQGLSAGNLKEIFGGHYWKAVEARGGLYRPVVMLSYAVDYALAGENSRMFHVTNILIHAVNGILVFFLLEMLFGRRSLSFLASLMFVLHPIRTEGVASIVGRAESLAAFFLLLSWIGYIRARETSNPRLFWVSAGLFLGAILSKESAYALLLLLPLTDYVMRSRAAAHPFSAAATAQRYLPYCLALALSLGLRYTILGGLAPLYLNPASNPLAQADAWPRLLTATHVFGRYIGLLVLPAALSADYSFNQIPVITSILSWRALIPALLLVALVASLCLAAKRRRVAFFCGALFFCCFVWVSNWIQPIGTIMAERLMYLPALGFNCAVALLLAQGLERARWRRIAAVATAVLLSGYAVRTFQRNFDWRDHHALFSSAVRTSPDSALVRANYAAVLLNDRNDPHGALEHARRAAEITPQNPAAHFTLGRAYRQTGNLRAAAEALSAVVRLAPRTSGGAAALRELAGIHESLGQASEAAAARQTLVQWRRKSK